MVDSRYMADFYLPVAVREGGGSQLFQVVLGGDILPSIIYCLSSYLIYYLKLLFRRCFKYIHSNT